MADIVAYEAQWVIEEEVEQEPQVVEDEGGEDDGEGGGE